MVTGQEVINHYDPVLPGLEVLQMVATDNLIIENNVDMYDYEEEIPNENHTVVSSPVVWSYVYPGCVVYRWDPVSRRILHRLDCSKLAPCSESLQSISIEEHLSPGRCQVNLFYYIWAVKTNDNSFLLFYVGNKSRIAR